MISANTIKRIKENVRNSCEYCNANKENVTLQRIIMSSGHTHVSWICNVCGRYARRSKHFIGRDVLEAWIQYKKIPPIEELPIFADKRTDETRCFVCGCLDVQLHHFAPKSLTCYFGDVELWPKEYLCEEHHKLWHSVLTPWMSGISASPLAIEILNKYYAKKDVIPDGR